MRLLVSGGGTGGHIYPALALIEDLKEKDPTAEILYVGTSRGLESRIVPDAGIDFKTIEIQGFKRSLSLKNLKTIYLFLRAFMIQRKSLRPSNRMLLSERAAMFAVQFFMRLPG